MTTEQNDSPDVRARRTEKQWRHEDRELTSTHALWVALVGLHGGLAGLAGVLVSLENSRFPREVFLVIGIAALGSMIGLAWLNYMSRNADAARAKYFETTARKVRPVAFDQGQEDAQSKALQDSYRQHQKWIEAITMFLFMLSALALGYVVLCP